MQPLRGQPAAPGGQLLCFGGDRRVPLEQGFLPLLFINFCKVIQQNHRKPRGRPEEAKPQTSSVREALLRAAPLKPMGRLSGRAGSGLTPSWACEGQGCQVGPPGASWPSSAASLGRRSQLQGCLSLRRTRAQVTAGRDRDRAPPTAAPRGLQCLGTRSRRKELSPVLYSIHTGQG